MKPPSKNQKKKSAASISDRTFASISIARSNTVFVDVSQRKTTLCLQFDSPGQLTDGEDVNSTLLGKFPVYKESLNCSQLHLLHIYSHSQIGLIKMVDASNGNKSNKCSLISLFG